MLKNNGRFFLISGFLLVFLSVALFGRNLIMDFQAGDNSAEALTYLEDIIDNSENNNSDYDASLFNNAAFYYSNPEIEMPVTFVGDVSYIGILQIPSINLRLPVIDSFSYQYLEYAPCRYYGSVYEKNLVIAAHNYYFHFGQLANLEPGNEVVFIDSHGTKFNYRTVLIETLNPNDVSGMCSDEWDLSLFTCTLGGQYRTTVRCKSAD